MDAFETDELVAAQLRPGEHTYVDFLREETLSLGMSVWPAGGEDTRPVRPGSVVYVGAGVEHRFHGVEEDLHVLVFWSPPYRSQADAPAPGEAAAH
jgi:hypothetical protein